MNTTNKIFQGAPCRRGHDGRRYVCNGACVTCTQMNGARQREKLKQPAPAAAEPGGSG